MVLRTVIVVTLALAACVAQERVVRLDKPEDVQVALLMEAEDGSVAAVPAAVRDAVERELGKRNLVMRPVDHAAFAERFARMRDSGQRLRVLARELPKGPLLLVEARASFFSQLAGRFRWAVSARLTLTDTTHDDPPLQEAMDLPAILELEHERAEEALASVARLLGERAGGLADVLLGGRDGARPSTATRSSAAAPEAELIYFVLLDRFANGDTTNDHGVDPRDPAGWHGGDIEGLIQRLDYLSELGVTTLWLSPIFATRDAPLNGHGAFHGYWVEDLRAPEPRFGDMATLRRLREAVEARGMRLMLDVVLNHVGYDAPLVAEKPHWFHRRGDVRDWDDPEQVVMNDVHGLPDLDQDHPEVYAHLLGASRSWIEALAPAGFRLDAVKHVPLSFWARYNADLQRAVPGFLLLGEMYDGNPASVARVMREGRFTSMFDFPMHFALVDFACREAPAGRLAAMLFADRAYEDPSRLVTFLDNHDLPRIATVCGSEQRVAEAMSLQFALRGTPSITYGSEVGLTGEGEPHNRKSMRFVAAHPLLGHLRKLSGLRRERPELARAPTRLHEVGERSLSFVRVGERETIFVAINGEDELRRMHLPRPLVEAGSARELLAAEPVEGGVVEVPPGAVRWVAVQPRDARAAAGLASAFAGGARRSVEFVVRDAPSGYEVRAVGMGEELGDWRPEQGAGPFVAAGALRRGRLELPEGGAFEYKLVARGRGEVRWESRPNRYLYVGPGEDVLRVELAWNET